MPLSLRDLAKVISAVKTELGFFTAVVVIVGSFFIAVVERKGFQLPVAIWAFALIIALLIATVGLRFVYNARRKYAGELQQNTSFARILGEEIYWALEGTIQNLPKGDQRQCYTTLVEAVPKSKHFHSAAQKEFSIALVEIIEDRAKTRDPFLARRKTPRTEHFERP